MAEQEVPSTEEVGKKKHINLALTEAEDADTIKLYEVIKAVSGVSNKEVFKLGLNAYKESEDFKDKVQIVKDLV